MKLMKLQLVGYTDGRPIGWGRFLLRWLVLSLLLATGIGAVLLLVFLVLQPRRQGWHDLVSDSVVIKERVLAPRQPPVPVDADRAAPPRTAEVPPPSPSEAPAPSEVSTPSRVPVPPEAPAVYSPVPGSGPMGGEPGFPHAPGAPSSEWELEGEPTAERPAPTAVPEPAQDGSTRDQDWSVVLDDGRELEVTGLVLLGRNPSPRPGEESAQLIKVSDQSRTVSKSHLALGVDGNGMYVTDRGSTNGSTLTSPDGQSRRCEPGEVVTVQSGSVVSFGDHWLEVRRSEPS